MDKKVLNFVLFLFIMAFPLKVDAITCTYNLLSYEENDEVAELYIAVNETSGGTVGINMFTNTNDNIFVFYDLDAYAPAFEAFPNLSRMENKFITFSDDFVESYIADATRDEQLTCPNIVLSTLYNATGQLLFGSAVSIFPPTYAETNENYHTIIPASMDSSKSCTVEAPVINTKYGATGESYNITFFINDQFRSWTVGDSSYHAPLISNDDYNIATNKYDHPKLPGTSHSVNVVPEVFDTIYGSELTCPEDLYICQYSTDMATLYSITLLPCYNELPSLDGLNQAIQCEGLFSNREEEGSVWWLLQKIFNYIKIFGPILVVVLSSIDFIKAIASSDEEAMKKSQSKLIIRLIAAVALFLIPTFVEILFDLIGGIVDPTCLLT